MRWGVRDAPPKPPCLRVRASWGSLAPMDKRIVEMGGAGRTPQAPLLACASELGLAARTYVALKYLAAGWWKTRAETEASGSIM